LELYKLLFKIQWGQPRVGSIPTFGTIEFSEELRPPATPLAFWGNRQAVYLPIPNTCDFFNSPLLGGRILRKIAFHRNLQDDLEESGKLSWQNFGN
jgi:hypothetical protein